MIKGILVINNHGKPRLTKFYEHLVSLLRSQPEQYVIRACFFPVRGYTTFGAGYDDVLCCSPAHLAPFLF